MVTVHISLAFYQNYLAFTVFDDAETEFNKLGAASYTLAQLAIEWTNVCAVFFSGVRLFDYYILSSVHVLIPF